MKCTPILKGGFCARIVCDDSKVEQTISDFEKPEHNPFIAVSVDMLDTGVDVPEVDNLVYGIEVLKCQKKNYSKQQEQIVNDANILLKKKANIEQVKAQIPLLTRIVDDSFYASSTILDLEDMRVKVRELIKFLVESQKKPIRYVDYIDSTLPVGEGTPVYTANNFEAYQKKVNSYITEHLDDEAILKLRNNVRLSQSDYIRVCINPK